MYKRSDFFKMIFFFIKILNLLYAICLQFIWHVLTFKKFGHYIIIICYISWRPRDFYYGMCFCWRWTTGSAFGALFYCDSGQAAGEQPLKMMEHSASESETEDHVQPLLRRKDTGDLQKGSRNYECLLCFYADLQHATY